MRVDPDDTEFVEFPRGRLPFNITRRQFFKSMLTEVEVRAGTRGGGDGWKLAEVGEWTDAQLSTVVPVVIPGIKIMIENDYVFGRQPSGKSKKLFKISSTACRIFNEFDGMANIDEIADTFARSEDWDPHYSFAFVRGVFLTLVLKGICSLR